MASSTAHRILRGDTYEYECSRTTNRMRGAIAILKGQGAEATRTHSSNEAWDWPTSRMRHVCDSGCTVTWPAWVTVDLVQQAYDTASALITARGSHHQAEASRLHSQVG